MKNPWKSVALTAFLVTGALATQAAATLPTNSVSTISIQLTCVLPAATNTSRSGTVTTTLKSKTIATKDVIQALGGGPTAQLLLLRPITYTTNSTSVTNHTGKVTTTITIIATTMSGNSAVILREKGVDTPVTGFAITPASTTVSVIGSTTTSSGVVESKITYRIDDFVFTSAILDFAVQGLDVSTLFGHKTKSGIVVTDESASLTSVVSLK